MLRFADAVNPTVNSPSFNSGTPATNDDAVPLVLLDAEEPPAPSDEKFHRPCGLCSKVTSGCSMVRLVTFSERENISGIIFTPTCKDFAARNADLLNAG